MWERNESLGWDLTEEKKKWISNKKGYFKQKEDDYQEGRWQFAVSNAVYKV